MINNNKSYWGPLLWASINTIVREYPENPTEEIRHNFKLFFQSLGDVLPCEECRNGYNKHLKQLSLENALLSRENLVDFIVDLHNEVNKSSGKAVMPRKNARDIIMGNTSSMSMSTANITIIIMTIIIIILLVKIFLL
jgi:hypothetical protein